MGVSGQAKARAARTILIVDDNPLIRGLLRNLFLSDQFSSCVEAGTGTEAIDLAKKHRPNLIVLDVAMPGMTGLEAAPVMKKILPATPIILFTLFGDHLKGWDLTKAGISATFSKTDPLDQLLHKAHELVGE
jgi:CheY-like chemotaxis protein